MNRASHDWLLLAGGICFAVGLVTVAGWLLGEPELVRLHADWVPMRFNAGLGMALAGLGLLARARGRRLVQRVLAALVLALGLGTLVQFVPGVSLGLDESLVSDFLARAGDPVLNQGRLPGRMGPSTAAGLVLFGLALLFPVASLRLALLQALLAASLCSLGVASLFAHMAGAVFLYDWGSGLYSSPMSVQAAVCAAVAGWALLRESLDSGRPQPGVPPVWLPLPVLVTGLLLTVLLWDGLATQARQSTRSVVDREVEAVQTILANRLQLRWQALTVLARDMEVLEGEGGRAIWRSVAEGYYASNPGMDTLKWVDPTAQVRWAYPTEWNAHLLGMDESAEPLHLEALRQARETGSIAVTRTVELRQGGQGFLSYVPVFRGGRLQGYLVADFRYRNFFERVLRDAGLEYGLEILEDGESLYRRAPEGEVPEGWIRERPIVLPGVTWTLRVWPSSRQLEHLASPLPAVALATGVVLSGLLSLIALYGQRASQRAWEASAGEERYRDLVENVRELICSHDEEGRLLSVNDSMLRLFGLSREEMLGRGIADFLTARARKEFPAYLERVLREGSAQGLMEVSADRGVVRILEYDNTLGHDQDGRVHVRGVSRDVTERVLAERELAHLRRQQERILQFVQEGIYEIGADGVARFVNPAACRILGYLPEEILGRNTHELFHHTRPDGSPYPVEECPAHLSLQDGQARAADSDCFWRRDGSSVAVEYSASPVMDSQGQIRGAVVTFRDITERREIQRMKDEFISVVSHELRTPLTSIRGSLGLLTAGKLGDLEPRGHRMLEIALANTERLVRLINDILDLERMSSGRAPLELQECDVRELLLATVQAVQSTADAAGVRVEAYAPNEGVLRADPDRVVQALTNLAGNAVKFSFEGGTVVLRARELGPWMALEVQDRGRGIPSEHRERIFERFHQVDGSDSRQKGGTGLGLAITRTIVEQHGGRIELESEPGAGSLFRLLLPKDGPQ